MADQDTSQGVIRLRVRDLTQLFNSLDPDPFIERDLDDDAVAFIVSWAQEVPKHVPLRLRVEIAEPRAGADHHAVVAAGVHNYFAQAAALAQNELRQLLRRGRLSLVIGLVALAVTHSLGWLVTTLGESPATLLAREGLIIGGWVGMWRPLDILLYEWWPVRAKRRGFERLRDMPVEVVLLRPPSG